MQMERSAIFKDATQSEPDTESLLKRLKVLTFGLGCEQFNKWIDSELYGYKGEDIPEYRKAHGFLQGDIIVGYAQIKNTSLPLVSVDDETRKKMLTYSFKEGVGALRSLLKAEQHLMIPWPPETYPTIKKGTNITEILSARLMLGITHVNDILTTVDNTILDILLELESKYGNLDKYDLDFSDKEKDEQMCQIIFQILVNNGVMIGNDNDLDKTNISLDNRKQK